MKKRFLGFMALVMAAVASMGVLAGCDGWFDKDDNADASVDVGSGSADESELTLLDKLYENKEHIVIDLTDPVTVLPQCSDTNWGGEATKSITINGNGNKLFLENKTNTHIKAAEGAKLVFNDVSIESVVNGGNTWNVHDVVFYNEAELNNVFFEQGIAFRAEGKTFKLQNVSIYERNDMYAIWVCAGVNVEMSDCRVLGGRGIKIADEYVGTRLSTVSITGTSFETSKKAAIVVSSMGGANISLSGVDISKVQADKVNAVWVDSDYQEALSKVSVTGGSMRYEG